MTVLDASAILGLVLGETSADRVMPHLDGGVVSAVNIAEVLGKLGDIGMPIPLAESVIERLHVEVVPFAQPEARAAAEMRAATKHLGLSLGDRACLATAGELGMPAVTLDRAWAQLDVGVPIEVLR